VALIGNFRDERTREREEGEAEVLEVLAQREEAGGSGSNYG
jgi:hypothetical protein